MRPAFIWIGFVLLSTAAFAASQYVMFPDAFDPGFLIAVAAPQIAMAFLAEKYILGGGVESERGE